MKTLYTIVACAILAISCTALPAGAETGAELKTVIDTLEKGYRLLEDVQVSFTQRATIASLKREVKGAGEMFIRRPGSGTPMFRFNYTKPEKQQIISDGKTVWIYQPEERQAMMADLSAAMESGGVTLNYLTGLADVSRDFTVTFAGSGRDRKGNYVLQLVPRKKSRLIERLQVTVSGEAVERYREEGKGVEPFPVVSSELFDTAGNRTLLEFARAKVNRGLGSSLFTFKPPKGVEVIKP